jgi:OOP family OmpA-OmpF porin
MNRNLFAAIVLSSFALPAMAASEMGTYYGALDVGALSYSNSGGGASNLGQDFPNPGAFRFAGGYRLTQDVTIEAGYAFIGDSTLDYGGGNKVTLSTSSLHATAVGAYPVTKEIKVFGKLGLGLNSSKGSGSGAYSGLSSSDSGLSLVYGFGAEYLLNKQISLRAQYESFGDTKISASLGTWSGSWKATSSMVSFGALYNF